MKKKIYFRSSELKQRGWTEGLIRKFLPKPDETKTNPIIRSAAPMKLYKIKRVEKIEKSEKFIKALESIFSLDGRQIDFKQKGVNIIRHKDGTKKKVMIK
jgi:hypothetical protein